MKRILVALSLAVLAVPAFAAEKSAPYDQVEIDRHLPNIPERSAASTKTQANAKTEASVWANDYNFIAPAQ